MKNILSERLRELRGAMSQTDFAAKIGVKQTSYSSWERGVKDPLAQTIIQISNTLGVSADWLLGLSDDRGGPRGAGQKFEPSKTSSSRIVDSRLSDAPLLAEIAALKRRVDALESQPSFACS